MELFHSRSPELSGRLRISYSQKHHMYICFCTSRKDRVNDEPPFCCCMLPSGISWGQNGDFWHLGKQCLQRWSVRASPAHAAPMPSPACWEVCLSPSHVCSADGIFLNAVCNMWRYHISYAAWRYSHTQHRHIYVIGQNFSDDLIYLSKKDILIKKAYSTICLLHNSNEFQGISGFHSNTSLEFCEWNNLNFQVSWIIKINFSSEFDPNFFWLSIF